jgi:hypothetical protein
MKNYKFTIIISLLFLSFNGTSQTTQIRKFEDYPLKGIVKNHLDSNMEVVSTDTIRVGVFYQISQINNGFLLIEKIHYKKGNHDYYSDVEWLDSNLITQKKFNKVVYQFGDDRFLLEQSNSTYNLFDFQLEKYILTNATKIITKDLCLPNPTYNKNYYTDYSYGYNQNPKEYCDFAYILFRSPQKSGVLDVNGSEIFSVPNGVEINYDNPNKLFTVHTNNQFDTYSVEGDKIASKVSKMIPITTTLIEGYTYFGYQNADGTMSLGTSQKLYIKNIHGSLLDIIADTNRFVAKLETGYVVFDTNGNQINKEPYEMIQPIRISQATIVKKDGIGYLVDRDLKPLNTDQFSYAELVGDPTDSYVYYQTKLQNQSQKGFYLYNAIGKQQLSYPIDAVYVPKKMTFYDIIFVEKDNLFAIQHSQGFTEFLYQKPKHAGDYGSDQITIAKRNNKYVVLIDSIEYLADYNLTNITAPDDINEYTETPHLFLYKGKKYSIGYLHVNYTDTTYEYDFKLWGDFAITRSQINYEIEDYFGGYLDLKNNTKWAEYYLESGTIVVGFELDIPLQISNEGSEVLIFTKDGKKGLASPTWNDDKNTIELKEVLPAEYDKIDAGDEYAWIWKNNKVGIYLLYDKELIIPIQYDNIYYSDDYDIMVLENNKLFGFTTLYNPETRVEPVLIKEPTLILENEFEEAIINNKKQVCQFNHNIQKLTCFDKIKPFPNTEGEIVYFWVKDKQGLYNTYDSDTILPAEFKNITLSQNADYYLTESLDGKYGVRQNGNRLIIPEQFDELKEDTEFYTDIFVVKQGSKWGAYQNGREELKVEYQAIELTDEHIIIQKDDKWGALNHYFQVITPTELPSKKALLKSLNQ